MRKNIRIINYRIIALILPLVIIANILIGCEIFGGTVISLNFETNSIAVELGDEYDIMKQLAVSNDFYASDVKISSNNENIVSTTASQTIRAMSVGKSTVRAELGNARDSITVEVIYKQPKSINLHSYGDIFQTLNNTSSVTFAAVMNEYIHPDYYVEWYVNDVKQAITGEYFSFTPANQVEVTKITARISGTDIADNKLIYVFQPINELPIISITNVNGGINAFSMQEGRWDIYVNNESMYSSESYCDWEFIPSEAGIYSITATYYGSVVSIASESTEAEEYIYIKGGNLLPRNITLEYDNCYPDSFITFEVPNVYDTSLLKYEIIITNTENESQAFNSVTNSSLFDGMRFNSSGIINILKKYKIEIAVSYGDNFADVSAEYHTTAVNQSALNYLSRQYLDKNYYISSDEEFHDIFKYIMWMRTDKVVESNKVTASFKVYMSYSSEYSAKRLTLLAWSRSGPPGYYYLDSSSGGVYKNSVMSVKITFMTENVPSLSTNFTTTSKPLLIPHVSFSGKYERELYIDSLTKTKEKVTNSNELYYVVERGFYPNLTVGSSAEELFNYAKNLLQEIISPQMTELDKIHAIYDWILWRTHYDKKVEKVAAIDEAVKYTPFYLESVLTDTNPNAVCDGLSKAFSLLCNMEGIKTIRVVGKADVGNNNFGEHAWNKVQYKGEWYLVDTTWADYETIINGKQYEVASHEYLMVSSGDLSNTHRENNLANFPKTATKPLIFFNQSIEHNGNAVELSFFETDIDVLRNKARMLVDYVIDTKPQSKTYTVGSGEMNTTSIDFYGIEFFVPTYNEEKIQEIIKQYLSTLGIKSYLVRYMSENYMHIQILY